MPLWETGYALIFGGVVVVTARWRFRHAWVPWLAGAGVAAAYLALFRWGGARTASWVYGLPAYLILWTASAHWSTARRRTAGHLLAGCVAGLACLLDGSVALLAALFWASAAADTLRRDGNSIEAVARQRLLPALSALVITVAAGTYFVPKPAQIEWHADAPSSLPAATALLFAVVILGARSLPLLRRSRLRQTYWKLAMTWLGAGAILVVVDRLNPAAVAAPAILTGLGSVEEILTMLGDQVAITAGENAPRQL